MLLRMSSWPVVSVSESVACTSIDTPYSSAVSSYPSCIVTQKELVSVLSIAASFFPVSFSGSGARSSFTCASALPNTVSVETSFVPSSFFSSVFFESSLLLSFESPEPEPHPAANVATIATQRSRLTNFLFMILSSSSCCL